MTADNDVTSCLPQLQLSSCLNFKLRCCRLDLEMSLVNIKTSLSCRVVANASFEMYINHFHVAWDCHEPRQRTSQVRDKDTSEGLRKSVRHYKFRTKTPRASSKRTMFTNKDISGTKTWRQRDYRGNFATTCLANCPRIYWVVCQILSRFKSNLRHSLLIMSMAVMQVIKVSASAAVMRYRSLFPSNSSRWRFTICASPLSSLLVTDWILDFKLSTSHEATHISEAGLLYDAFFW